MKTVSMLSIACIHAEACAERAIISGVPMNWGYYKSAKVLDTNLISALHMERTTKATWYIYGQPSSHLVYAYYDAQRYINVSASDKREEHIMNNFNSIKKRKVNPDPVLSPLDTNKTIYISRQIYQNQESELGICRWERRAFVIGGDIVMTKLSLTKSKRTVDGTIKDNDLHWPINSGCGNNPNTSFRLDSKQACTLQFFNKYDRFNIIPTKDMNIISRLSKKYHGSSWENMRI